MQSTIVGLLVFRVLRRSAPSAQPSARFASPPFRFDDRLLELARLEEPAGSCLRQFRRSFTVEDRLHPGRRPRYRVDLGRLPASISSWRITTLLARVAHLLRSGSASHSAAEVSARSRPASHGSFKIRAICPRRSGIPARHAAGIEQARAVSRPTRTTAFRRTSQSIGRIELIAFGGRLAAISENDRSLHAALALQRRADDDARTTIGRVGKKRQNRRTTAQAAEKGRLRRQTSADQRR